MSKLYKKYIKLKNDDSHQIYLFKAGTFYISLEEDTRKLSDIFDFKLTNLNNSIIKCGFPASHIHKYVNIFKVEGIDFTLIDEFLIPINIAKDYLKNPDIVTMLKKIDNLDINKIPPIECFRLINKLKHLTNNITAINRR